MGSFLDVFEVAARLSQMQLIINGKAQEVGSASVAALVEELRLNPKQVAIEKNREIVPRSTYANEPLSEGDIIEVVAFVGGG